MSKQIQDAYIVSAVRTPVGKAPRGMFRNTRPDDLLAHVLRQALAQCQGLDPARIDDVVVGCAMPEAEQGMNVARIGLLLAGLPDTVPGMTGTSLLPKAALASNIDFPDLCLRMLNAARLDVPELDVGEIPS